LLGIINGLEEKYKLWEKSKEKATKMLWWDDVAKGLAKQKQQTEQSEAETKKEQSADTSTNQTETLSTPATLSQMVGCGLCILWVFLFSQKRK
ncbi:hypothetical protein J3U35_05625, partial [Gilliamella sp. B2717]|uniref:hypothetical protein n=1 Tax=Gilliamella sp. B2717 TaxID=2817996 RepID=UPI00226991A0